MQLPNAPEPAQFQSVENTLQSQRLERYIAATGTTDRAALFKFYIWNCALCEAFYLPLQFAEIACRNAIHKALLNRVGPNWFNDPTLIGMLGHRFQSELASAISDENAQHGAAMTAHHVCSALNFGFWEHLTTKRFHRRLWKWGITHNFPHAPGGTNLENLHDHIESVRRWRNRIAHHKAIFDKGPSRKYQDTLTLIRWVCPDTATWVSGISRVQQVINAKPTV